MENVTKSRCSLELLVGAQQMTWSIQTYDATRIFGVQRQLDRESELFAANDDVVIASGR